MLLGKKFAPFLFLLPTAALLEVLPVNTAKIGASFQYRSDVRGSVNRSGVGRHYHFTQRNVYNGAESWSTQPRANLDKVPLAMTAVRSAPVSISPLRLTFAAQEIGTTSSSQTAILTNASAGVLTIRSIAVSGDFSQTNNCGGSLATRASCSVTVKFTPTAAGPRVGVAAITITDYADSIPYYLASLSGKGTAVSSYCGAGNIPSFGKSDGPAALPQSCYYTGSVATPSPGAIRVAKDASSFNKALAAAACGDIIEITANSEISGHFIVPAKRCDANHYVTIRTSGYASLPQEGMRVTPCYAGVTSLPGRFFMCSSVKNVMAKITTPDVNPVLTFATGANHYRLIGLELAHSAAGYNAGIIKTFTGADHIIFDRIYCHGHGPDDETARCMGIGSSTYVAIIDSFISEIKCASNSKLGCGDAQTVHLGGTNHVGIEGTWKIVNNFLEASTENVLSGGGGDGPGCCIVPSDVEIRRNHFFKPWTLWDPFDCTTGTCVPNHSWIGVAFSVKNGAEMKSGQRWLWEGNIWDSGWGGQMALLFLSPKDQGGAGHPGLCPRCLVQDITIRYNIFRHAPVALAIAGTTSDPPARSCTGPLSRVSVHDVVGEDLSQPNWGQGKDGGRFVWVDTGFTCPPVNNVSIRHSTAFPNSHSFLRVDEGNAPQETMTGFVFQDNIVPNARYGVLGNRGQYKTVLDATFGVGAYTFDHNVIQGGGNHPYPRGNFFPQDWASVRFVDFKNGNGGDYHLSERSPYKRAGSDGKDPGADIDLVLSYTSGVADSAR